VKPCKNESDAAHPEKPADVNRRRFLTLLTGFGAVGLHGLNSSCSPAEKPGDESRPAQKPGTDSIDPGAIVARLARPGIVEAGQTLPAEKAMALLEALLGSLGPGAGAAGFFKTVFQPGQKIGIKLNCLAGRGLSTRPELVYALIKLLAKADIPPSDVIVFERTERELKRAGFPIRMRQSETEARIMGNDSDGAGFDHQPLCHESIGSCFCTILTRRIDAMINFGVLKDHDLAGVSIGMKNLYGLIHNPNKYHDQGCAPYVAHVAASPPVRKKLKLTICDGLIAQYHGGPALKPAYTWNAGLLLASRDPVALDTVGTAIIEEKRKAQGIETLQESGRYPAWLRDAKQSGLGENLLEKIFTKTV